MGIIVIAALVIWAVTSRPSASSSAASAKMGGPAADSKVPIVSVVSFPIRASTTNGDNGADAWMNVFRLVGLQGTWSAFHESDNSASLYVTGANSFDAVKLALLGSGLVIWVESEA